MESQTYVILLIILMTIGIVTASLRYGSGRIGKCKPQQTGGLTPFWRRWKPSDPSRCAQCRVETVTHSGDPAWPYPAPTTWAANKSKRGRKKSIDSTGHFCPNPDCLYYLNVDPQIHALVSNGHHGQQSIRQWVCQACGTYVSERHDTAMSHLKRPLADVAWTLALLNRGTSQADAARHHRHDPRTVRLWLKRAAGQAMRIHDAYFQNLNVGNIQLDELVGDIKGAPNRHFIWTSLDAATKIVPVWHVGRRKLDDAQLVVHQLKDRLAPSCRPIFTSDQLRHYYSALTSHFGAFRQGRRKPVWHVSPTLLYAQVVKLRSRQRLKYTLTRPIFGTRGQIRDALQARGLSGRIQTAFVERGNLTLRQLIAALHRRTWSMPWSITTLDHRLAWFFAFYHWMRPHQALASQTFKGQRYKVCTPAMAAGLTDHIWGVDEFLLWRPSQRPLKRS